MAAVDPETTSALTVALVGVAGTVLVALLGAVALVWSSKIQSKTTRDAKEREDSARLDEREHDAVRRREEREEEARQRAEERAAAEQQEVAAVAALERRSREQRRDDERSRQAEVARRFLASAENVYQGLRRRALEYANLNGMLPEGDWNELSQALADVGEAFEWEVADGARRVVNDLRSAMVDVTGRQVFFANIESGLATFADDARHARNS